MTLVNHQNGTSGGYSPDVFFDFNAFEQKIHRVFHGTPMIKSCKVTHTEDSLVIYMDFDEVLEKFSFIFEIKFVQDYTPCKTISHLKQVTYEIPKKRLDDDSLEEYVYIFFRNEVVKRINGALAEQRFVEIMNMLLSNKKYLEPKDPLRLISSYIISGKENDISGIDAHIVVIASHGHKILNIDIKSYENGLKLVKDKVVGLYIHDEISDEMIVHKVRTIVEGFLEGKYLRI